MSRGVIFISYATLSNYPRPPPEVVDFIDPALWQQVRVVYSVSNTNANAGACLGEFICCILFSFPFIFLCHFCISSTLRDNEIRREIMNINYVRFGGQKVFEVVNGGITLNTQLIPAQSIAIIQQLPPEAAEAILIQSYPQSAPATIVESASPTNSSNVQYAQLAVPVSSTGSDPSKVGSSEPVLATAVSQSSSNTSTATPTRSMVVTLPQQIYPYAIIRVQSPEGLQVSVTVPRDAYPGQRITVQY